ncbi:hypothetical protein BC936DRAFT_140899 [Jimgerdemannia flammicorona]|uniref:Uncharacterized protein n=1 Tax=Jimgerdemannia flammicorona TaxID=994334 RepID=A0A433A383_9FUNG|nr:hypothetical protein BC936DRAFT_140899 [Jimgerdemannia flammicorona]
MHAPDLPAAAFTARANSQTLILRRDGPYWLYCTDTDPRVRRFIGDQFVDSFEPPPELPTIFATLECLVSPGEASTGAIITQSRDTPAEVLDVEDYAPKHQRDWREVCENDLDCLRPGECLNDIVIDEYMSSVPQKSTPVTIFNTFFCVLWRKDPAKVIGKFDPYGNRFSLIPVHERFIVMDDDIYPHCLAGITGF